MEEADDGLDEVVAPAAAQQDAPDGDQRLGRGGVAGRRFALKLAAAGAEEIGGDKMGSGIVFIGEGCKARARVEGRTR